MNNSDKNIKKLFAILIGSALFLVIFIFCLMLRLSQRKPVTLEQETTVETVTESVLETQFAAAASVHTELTDILSETVTEQEFSSVSSETDFSEPEPVHSVVTAMPTEILPETSPVQTEIISSATEVIAIETEYFTSICLESTAPEVSSETTTTETSSVPANAPQTYHTVLESIMKFHYFGEENFEFSYESDMEENEFAIYDIDLDGTEELIIRWSNGTMGSIKGIIYGKDSNGNIYPKLLTTPYLRFYANGVIEADMANSTLNEDFWTYTLYQYDSSSGTYQETAFVDSWSKKFADVNLDTGEPFPDYVDVSQTGIVYYVRPSGSATSDPMDVTQYENWHSSYISPNSEINLPFRKFTEANILEVP